MVDAVVKLTGRLLAQSRIIAKGKHIREVNRLVTRYGGRPSKWVKKSSPQIEMGNRTIEYHWYEHPSIGRFEMREVQVDPP
jgi:hypothetical protein